MRLFDFFSEAKSVRLAVVGTTGSGKTYLLSDLVGALERLGYKRDDSYEDTSLHRDVYNLTGDNSGTRGVDKTPVYACRQENVYASRFLDPTDHRMMFEFADVPGEVMTPDSLNMFRAVMKALMACTSSIFTVTKWKNQETGKVVRIVEMRSGLSRSERGVIGLDGAIRAAGSTVTNATGDYMSTGQRKAYYQGLGFREEKTTKLSGDKLFRHFLDYDTDSAINAIIQAWDLLKVDGVLPHNLRPAGTGRQVFRNAYKKHFFFHYYTFHATDVVVCDRCCGSACQAASGNGEAIDHFTGMMQVLKDLTSYKDAPVKNWFMALKGFDLVMREKPFRQLFELTGDINLVYSHFLVLFRKVCEYRLDTGDATAYHPPFSSDERMMQWLTGDERLIASANITSDAPNDVVGMLSTHYKSLGSAYADFFAAADNYTVASGGILGNLVRDRARDFCHVDERLAFAASGDTDEQSLLHLPQHVYLVATPIDEDFHICAPCAEDPTSFEGQACHYNHRAHFGALQLTTGILLQHGLQIGGNYENYGFVLDYVHGVEI